jgi:hypothetical protein
MKAPKQLKNYASVVTVATATLLPFAMATPPASADDLFFPASLCQPSTAEDATKLQYVGSSVNVIGNLNAQVICPITNRVLISKHLAILKSSSNAGFPPNCNLRSFDRNGSVLEISGTTFNSNNPTEQVTKKVIPGTYHTLLCALPPGSKIFYYRLVE